MMEDDADLLLQQAIEALIQADNMPSAATTLIANGISLLAASEGVEFDDKEMEELLKDIRFLIEMKHNEKSDSQPQH